MKLVCPHCAKVIDVPESLAGQTTNCSLCQGPLTVPFAAVASPPPASVPPAGPPAPLPPLPPPPPAPSVPDPLGTTTAWSPAPSGTVVPPLTPLPTTSASGGGRGADLLHKLRHLSLPASFHDWFGLGVLCVIFLLFFFTWAGVSVGNTILLQQSGIGIAFGSASAMKEAASLHTGLSGTGLMMIAFLASIAGLLLLVVLLVERFVHNPSVQNIKPILNRFASLKDYIVLGCLILITLIFLTYYLFMSFPLEQAAWSEKASDTMLLGLNLKTEGIQKITSYEMVGMQWLYRSCWFGLATLLAIAGLASSAYHWCSVRGYCQHWPKLVIQWPASHAPQLTFDAPMPASGLTRPPSSSTAP